MVDGAERRVDELEAVVACAIERARADSQETVDVIAAQSRPVGELTDLITQRTAYAKELSAKLENISVAPGHRAARRHRDRSYQAFCPEGEDHPGS